MGKTWLKHDLSNLVSCPSNPEEASLVSRRYAHYKFVTKIPKLILSWVLLNQLAVFILFDLSTHLADWPWGWIGKASNAIPKLALPWARHQWPKTRLALEVRVETPTRPSLLQGRFVSLRVGIFVCLSSQSLYLSNCLSFFQSVCQSFFFLSVCL